MKTNFYFKHSLMALNDPRMKRLLKTEKLKGIGAYWFILEKLELLLEPRATMDYLRPFCCKEIPYPYIQDVILNSGLFEFDEEGYFMPAELNPVHKKTVKNTENAQENPQENPQETSNSQSEATDFREKKSDFTAKKIENHPKNDENRTKIIEKQAGNRKKESPKTLKNSNSAKKSTTNIKKKKIEDRITTTEKEKEKETAAAAVVVETATTPSLATPLSSSAALPPTQIPPLSITCCDDNGRPQRPLRPVRPWQEMVSSLTEDSQWLEIACLKSCYAPVLMRNIKQAVEIFRQHIEVYDKGADLLTMSDVHRYFINFVSSGSRTSNALHEALLALEAKKHPVSADPYRYEQLCNGKRTYMGCPIPDDAPPRPDENAIWDEEAKRWITILKP